MSFYNLALNNIRKKFGSYSIYLVSAVFAVTVFSIFCSMYFNPQFSQFRFGAGKMALLFKISAVAVLVFSSVFIFYANNFFVKTRKKEIAIYSLLGMKKRQIGRMLFYANIFIGLIAIAGGIFLGTLLSRFFSMIMFNLMKQIPKVDPGIRWEAVAITIIAFLIIFVINSLNAYSVIYRFKLIDLLSAGKEGETIPKYSLLGGILSVVILTAGYVYALSIDFNKGGLKQLPSAALVIVLVVLGTALFFGNFIPMVVVKLKKNKRIYFRSTNFISLSQIAYRIKANSGMLGIIAVLSAITVTMISATFVMYNGFAKAGSLYTPYSYLSYNVDDTQYEKVVEAINNTGEVKLASSSRFTLINATCETPLYAKDTTHDSSGGEIPTQMFSIGDPFDAYIISASDYKNIIKDLNVKKGEFNNQRTDFDIDLKNDECFFIDGNMDTTYCKDLSGQKVRLKTTEKSGNFDITGVSMHKYLGVFKFIRKTTIVLNDEAYHEFMESASKEDTVSFMGLVFDDPMNSKKTVEALDKIIPENAEVKKTIGINNLNTYELNSSIYTQYGAYLFIGTFLGILFLLASGSIMYYKQIIEAEEEVGRYDILKKTGMKRLEVKRSISKQLAVVFGMPLLVGLLHSVFAMIAYNNAMMFVAEEVAWAYLQEACICAVYILIYYFYYRLTVSSYLNIVWKKV